jgi:hypothetical protein
MKPATSSRIFSRSALSEARGLPPARSRSSSASSVADEPGRRLVVPPDFVGIGVDLDHLLVRPEHRGGAPAPDRQHHVGRVEIAPQRARREEPGAEREIARVADRALALGRLDDTGLQVFGERGERRVSVREMHAAARVDGDPLRAQQHLGRAIDVGGRRGGARRVRGHGRQSHVDLFLHRVPRHVDRDRTRAAAAQLREGLVDDARRVGHLHDGLTPLRRAGDGVELVVELVEHADLLADLVAWNLSGDHQHGRGGRVRGVQSRRRVQQARSGYGHRDADAAAGARIAVGHVGR